MKKNKTDFPHLPETGFIRLPVLLSLIPISKSSLYSGIQQGIYPQPVKLSARTSAWRVEDIRELIDQLSNGGVSHV